MSLNQIVKELRTIADNHPQINHFFEGEEYNFASSGVVNCPAMIVVPQPHKLSGSVLKYNFKIYIGDLVHKDLSNRPDVLSDTLQILLDVIYKLQAPEFEGVIDTEIQLNDFEDSFDCELYGYWSNISIRFSNPFNICAVPEITDIDCLLQENGGYLLQENGQRIIL